MDLSFCINVNSFPANSKEKAKELFNDSLKGVLNLVEGGERVTFYLETRENKRLLDLELADGYSYESFLYECEDFDLKAFLFELEDKSPALDTLSEEQQNELMGVQCYADGREVGDDDLYALAWVLECYILSLATEECWESEEIKINTVEDDGRYGSSFYIKNISCEHHGVLHFNDYLRKNEVDIDKLLYPHKATSGFNSWFYSQNSQNKNIIINKIEMAKKLNFQGGEPLFKTLREGIREIRMFAFSGGAIRIFFKKIKDFDQLIILGFVKYSDNEGYDKNIPNAVSLFNDYFK